MLFEVTDPFAQPGTPRALACRAYPTQDGLAGPPTFEQLSAALTQR